MVTDTPAVLTDEQPVAAPALEHVAEERSAAPARRWSPVAVAIWVLFAGGMTLFIAFGRVPIAAGWRQGRSMSVLDIWSFFTLELATLVPWLSPTIATIVVLLVLAGSLLCLWLAMSVTGDDPPSGPD